MRRNIRVIALIAMLTLLICQFSIFASGSSKAEDNTLEMLDILIGIDALSEDVINEAELSNNMTRAEYMGVMGKIFNLADDTTAQVFADVPVSMENAGYINSAYKLGYISGDGSGYFYPSQAITHSQALKILFSAMGYGVYINEAYKVPGYNIALMSPKLASSISYSADKGLTKAEAVALIYNALDVPVMSVDYIKADKDGNIIGIYPETTESGSLLTEVLKLIRVKGVVNADYKTNLDSSSVPKCGEDEIEINGVRCKYYGTEDLVGLGVTAFISSENGIYTVKHIVTEEDSVLAKISYDEAAYEDGYIYWETDDTEKKFIIKNGVSVMYNGSFIGTVGTSYVSEADFETESGYFLLIDNNRDGRTDVIKIVEYTTVFVSNVNRNDNTLTDYYAQSAFEIDNSDEWTFIKNGIEVKFERINTNNALSIIKSRDERVKTVIISDKKVNGTVSAVKKEGVVINDKTYKISNYYNSLIENNNKQAEKIKVGSCGTFYLDTAGEIVAFSDVIKENYGYVVGKKLMDEERWTDTAEIKFYTENERFDIFTLAEKVKVINGLTSVRVTANQALSQIELYDVVKFELNDDKQIKTVELASPQDIVSEEYFTKNVNKSELQFHMDVLGAKYCISSDTIFFNVPDPETSTAEEIANVENYSTIRYLLGNEKYTVDVYDLDEYRSAGVVVNYTDSSTGPLATGYADPFVVSDVCEVYIDDEVCYSITGWQGGAEKTIYAKDSQMQQDTSVSNANAWVVEDGYAIEDVKIGDVLQYAAKANNFIDRFRVIYRPDFDPDLWEKWTNSDDITATTIRAHMYTACAKVVAVNDKQMVFKTPTGEKVITFTNYTAFYVVNTETDEVDKTLKTDIHIGDKVVFMMNYSNVYAVIIYR